jgi:hypothetical protein
MRRLAALFFKKRQDAASTIGVYESFEIMCVRPFLHGIVAFNGWPLNTLRLDNNYEKVNLPIGKNSAKKTAFFRENGASP